MQEAVRRAWLTVGVQQALEPPWLPGCARCLSPCPPEMHRLEPGGAEAGAGPDRAGHHRHPPALQAPRGGQRDPQGRSLFSKHGKDGGLRGRPAFASGLKSGTLGGDPGGLAVCSGSAWPRAAHRAAPGISQPPWEPEPLTAPTPQMGHREVRSLAQARTAGNVGFGAGGRSLGSGCRAHALTTWHCPLQAARCRGAVGVRWAEQAANTGSQGVWKVEVGAPLQTGWSRKASLSARLALPGLGGFSPRKFGLEGDPAYVKNF